MNVSYITVSLHDGNMSQDELPVFQSTMNVVKPWRVSIQRILVVVSLDQHFLTMATTNSGNVAFCNRNITQMNYFVCWTNNLVPHGDESLIHLFCGIPRAHGFTVLVRKRADVLMPKMGIGYNECFYTHSERDRIRTYSTCGNWVTASPDSPTSALSLVRNEKDSNLRREYNPLAGLANQCLQPLSHRSSAERVGFEPTGLLHPLAFKASAFVHSAISPMSEWQDLNLRPPVPKTGALPTALHSVMEPP